jgi:hypothetical protein
MGLFSCIEQSATDAIQNWVSQILIGRRDLQKAYRLAVPRFSKGFYVQI